MLSAATVSENIIKTDKVNTIQYHIKIPIITYCRFIELLDANFDRISVYSNVNFVSIYLGNYLIICIANPLNKNMKKVSHIENTKLEQKQYIHFPFIFIQ